jgi:hypothetical protein
MSVSVLYGAWRAFLFGRRLQDKGGALRHRAELDANCDAGLAGRLQQHGADLAARTARGAGG